MAKIKYDTFNFLPTNRHQIQSLYIFRFALKNDLPLLEYCTLPRTGALEVIMQVIGPDQEKLKTKDSQQIHNELLNNEISKNEAVPNLEDKSRSETGRNDESQNSQEIVTNNNQTKWNTEQYFR